MITTGLMNLAYYVVQLILSLFPADSGFPEEVHNAMIYFGGYLGILDVLVPIDTLATAVGLVFTIELTIFGYKTVKSLISHVPFVGGKGV
jgi:hypothetical protein